MPVLVCLELTDDTSECRHLVFQVKNTMEIDFEICHTSNKKRDVAIYRFIIPGIERLVRVLLS